MRALDAYLTTKAAQQWPGATVTKQVGTAAAGEPTGFVLYRPNRDPLGLGNRFHRARMALAALVNQSRINNADQNRTA
jgi:hypothetical protein